MPLARNHNFPPMPVGCNSIVVVLGLNNQIATGHKLDVAMVTVSLFSRPVQIKRQHGFWIAGESRHMSFDSTELIGYTRPAASRSPS